MDQDVNEKYKISLEEEMKNSYLDYAMSVIVGRALPDARDGLKPVHRRILYAMYDSNNLHNKPFVKCARVVGEVMGKFHPHGDNAIYDTLVRMAQEFSMREPLIDGQGNFGSIDGDNAAAMRYTECRLSKISSELLSDIDKETVDFVPNYDEKELEPSVLPSRIPNLLVNGSSGIAVGMATNIPPHNLTEVINASIKLLRYGNISIEEIIEILPAPDFPTKGIIYGTEGIKNAYRSGRGRVLIRAKTHFEDIPNTTRQAIIIDELPYQVNKSSLLIRIGELVRSKKIEGISEIRDESDKSGMRVVFELKKNENPEVVQNNLYKESQLQDSFGMNMVALINNEPKLLNIKQILNAFLFHRREIVTRKAIYELRKAREKVHILEGLAIALSNVDNIISLIKSATAPNEAKIKLMEKGWASEIVTSMLGSKEISLSKPDDIDQKYGIVDGVYFLSDMQAQKILEMQLQKLTALEKDKINNEYQEFMDKIYNLVELLKSDEKITQAIENELTEIKKNFGSPRKSEIQINTQEISLEDLIAPENVVVTLSHAGYIKSQPLTEYRAQKRGGRGKQATTTKEDDFVDSMFVANTHDFILCFSDKGRMYWLKVYEVPQGGRGSRGKPIINLVKISDQEKITTILPVNEFDENHFVVMSTALGVIKKTPLSFFSRPRQGGIIAIGLDASDYLIGVALTDGVQDIMLFSNSGKAVRFSESDVRPTGRTSRGVRGMRLNSGEILISLVVIYDQNLSILTATEHGFGKRTPVIEYTKHSRGNKGMIAIQTSKRNGKVLAARLVEETEEIMLITTRGILIRTRVSEIREMGRSTQGVKLINLAESEKLAGLEKTKDSYDDVID